jgi:hypothetical protein
VGKRKRKEMVFLFLTWVPKTGVTFHTMARPPFYGKIKNTSPERKRRWLES